MNENYFIQNPVNGSTQIATMTAASDVKVGMKLHVEMGDADLDGTCVVTRINKRSISFKNVETGKTAKNEGVAFLVLGW